MLLWVSPICWIAEGADEIESEEKATMLEIINTNNELFLKLVNDVGNIPFGFGQLILI